MAQVINNLIDGLFAFLIVGLFIWFILARIQKKPMFSMLEGMRKPTISNPQKLTTETWRTNKTRI